MSLCLAAGALLVGCATGYQDSRNLLLGWTGGYWEQRGPGELIKVGFSGNVMVSKEKVQTYLMYRCAEVAAREKKPFFAFYPNLVAAVRDQRADGKPASSLVGRPTTHAYILLFDAPERGLLETGEVLSRLATEVRGGEIR